MEEKNTKQRSFVISLSAFECCNNPWEVGGYLELMPSVTMAKAKPRGLLLLHTINVWADKGLLDTQELNKKKYKPVCEVLNAKKDPLNYWRIEASKDHLFVPPYQWSSVAIMTVQF